ncbi:MAG TPA: 50S ribosomal protein L1 [Thermomicrobiales bacterium]|nr:50S ribosomal protein L1 [Thermomicrobiales bacterium]
MVKHGKRYEAAAKQVDQDKAYRPADAVALLKQIAFANFDETVEVHFKLGIDPRHADQQVRSTATLPHGTGKPVRVIVFAEGDAARIARDAGVEEVGSDDLVKRIEDGFLDFDIAIAMADQMGKVGKLGRILGRRGLMPNPRSGTVVRNADDLPRVIDEVRGGRVEFRNDRTGLLHVPIGKKSFTEGQIADNMLALVDAVNRAKPSGQKGVYVQSITLTTTMSPGVPLDVAGTLGEAAARQ